MENNHKKIILIVFLCFILPATLYLSRPGFHGLDSHYYLTKICSPEQNHFSPASELPLTNLVIPILPCDYTILKAILIALYGLSLIALWKIAEYTWRGTGWLMVLFTGISTVLLFSSFKLENDAFAIPLLYLALYFFIKYTNPKPTCLIQQKKDYKALIISFLLLGIAGLFWGGAIYYLIAFLFILFPRITIILLGALFLIPETGFFTERLASSIFANYGIFENNPLMFFYLNFIYLLLIAFGTEKLSKNPWYAKLTIIFIILSFLNPKLLLLAVPFISLYVIKNYLIATRELQLKLPFNLKFPIEVLNKKISAKKVFVIIAIFLCIFHPISVSYFTTPTSTQLLAAEETVKLSEETGLPISNNWDFGHLIWFKGGVTKWHSGPGLEISNKETVLLTYEEQLDNNCELKKEFREPSIISKARPDLYLYEC